jgi:hypothetical protein
MTNNSYKNDLVLKAYLNELTPDVPDDYLLRVDTQDEPLDVNKIAQSVATRSGKYESSEIASLLQLSYEVIAEAVSTGHTVNTPLCNIRPVATGTVMEADLSKPVDRSKVRVYMSFSQGALAQQSMDNVHLVLDIQPALTGPYIAGISSTDAPNPDTGTRAAMRAGRMAVLSVRNGKLAGEGAGITFTSVADPNQTFFVPANEVNPNTASKLQCILPAGMTDGEWVVKISTRATKNATVFTKTLRSFELARPFTIGAKPSGGDEKPGGGEENPGGGGEGTGGEGKWE